MTGIDDYLRIGLVLMGGALFFVSGWALALGREAGRRRAAIAFIHREIKAALDTALQTDGPASISAAETFAKRVRLYLGPLLEVGSGEGKALSELETALKGMVKETPAPPPPVPGLPAGGASSAASASGGASAAAASAGGVAVTVVTTTPAATEREASTREHIDQVRRALMACAPFYALENLETRLARVQQALSFPPKSTR
jgi:hypothetical protein